VAINKSDLGSRLGADARLDHDARVVHVSALSGEGIEELIRGLLEPFGGVDSESEGLLITDSRHFDLLRRAQGSVTQSLELLDEGASEEIVLVGLHSALRFLGEIT